jgi:xylulokinase
VLDLPLRRYRQAEAGAAFGAARLARLACTSEAPDDVCTPPSGEADIFTPHPDRVAAYAERHALWRRAAEVCRRLR